MGWGPWRDFLRGGWKFLFFDLCYSYQGTCFSCFIKLHIRPDGVLFHFAMKSYKEKTLTQI